MPENGVFSWVPFCLRSLGPFERCGSLKLHERIWLRQLEPTGCFYICVQNNLICFLFFVFICCDVFFYHWRGVGRRVLFWQGGGLVCQRLSAIVNADFGGVQVLLEGEASTLTPNCLGSPIPVLNQAARVTGYYCALMCNTIILSCKKCAWPPLPLP